VPDDNVLLQVSNCFARLTEASELNVLLEPEVKFQRALQKNVSRILERELLKVVHLQLSKCRLVLVAPSKGISATVIYEPKFNLPDVHKHVNIHEGLQRNVSERLDVRPEITYMYVLLSRDLLRGPFPPRTQRPVNEPPVQSHIRPPLVFRGGLGLRILYNREVLETFLHHRLSGCTDALVHIRELGTSDTRIMDGGTRFRSPSASNSRPL